MSVFDGARQTEVMLRKLIDESQLIEVLKNAPPEYEDTQSYADGIEIANRLQALLAELHKCDLTRTPVEDLRALKDQTDAATKRLRLLESFDMSLSNQGGTELNHILSETMREWQTFYNTVSTAIVLAARPASLDNALTKINERLDEAKQKQDAINDWFSNAGTKLLDQHAAYDQVRQDCEIVLSDIRTKLGDIGASHHAVRFAEESDQQRKESHLWLAIIVGVAICMGFYAISLEPDLREEIAKSGSKLIWPLFAMRGIILSLGSVLLFIGLRSFSACRHNSVVNKHRANALDTFQIFHQSAKDDETKAAVLLEATKAVFAPAASGYLKAASDTTPSHIIELVKNTVVHKE
jgi:hypothetical protein